MYSENQAQEILQFWPESTKLFIVGGTADGNEAQTITRAHPNVKCLGFEPNPKMFKIQTEMNFPGKLLTHALWHSNGPGVLKMPHDLARSASVCRDLDDHGCELQQVELRTLDSLEGEEGPFDDCVLWVDIECAELQSLYGATRLLTERKVLLINAEIMSEKEERDIDDFLTLCNFTKIHRWNNSMPNKWDVVYRLESV